MQPVLASKKGMLVIWPVSTQQRGANQRKTPLHQRAANQHNTVAQFVCVLEIDTINGSTMSSPIAYPTKKSHYSLNAESIQLHLWYNMSSKAALRGGMQLHI
jgi:hypothetical protein